MGKQSDDPDALFREDELLSRAKDGDHNAFDTLVLLHSRKLFHAAYTLLGNRQDAEEVVQDAFVRAWKALATFRGDSSFETWMHRITLNLARNRFHWNRRRGEGLNVSLSAPPPSSPDDDRAIGDWDLPDVRMTPDRALENTELESNIAMVIGSMPEKFRQSLVLRHRDEMSYDAIAKETGVPINTVKTRIKRARELLRSGLDELEQK